MPSCSSPVPAVRAAPAPGRKGDCPLPSITSRISAFADPDVRNELRGHGVDLNEPAGEAHELSALGPGKDGLRGGKNEIACRGSEGFAYGGHLEREGKSDVLPFSQALADAAREPAPERYRYTTRPLPVEDVEHVCVLLVGLTMSLSSRRRTGGAPGPRSEGVAWSGPVLGDDRQGARKDSGMVVHRRRDGAGGGQELIVGLRAMIVRSNF